MTTGGRAPASSNTELNPIVLRRLVWLIGLVAWGLVAAALLSYSPADAPGHAWASRTAGSGGVSNWVGPAGASLSHSLFSMLGLGAWVVVLWAGVYLLRVAFRGPMDHPVVRTLGVLLIGLALSGFHALLLPTWSSAPEGGGGLVAIAGSSILASKFGTLGAALWITLIAIVGMTVAFDRWLLVAPKAAAAALGLAARTPLGGAVKAAPGALAARLARPMLPRENDLDDDRRLANPADALVEAKKRKLREKAEAQAAIDEETGGIGGAESFVLNAKGAKNAKKNWNAEDAETGGEEDAEIDDGIEEEADASDDAAEIVVKKGMKPGKRAPVVVDEEEDSELDEDDDSEAPAQAASRSPQAASREFTPDELREKISKLPIRFASVDKRAATQDDLDQLRAQRATEEEAERKYAFPPLDLLENPEEGYNTELEKLVREQAESLEGALRTYGISGEVASIESGPVVTLYHVRLAPGTKVSSITSVASDLARALKSVNIRVVSNMEGTDTVGIEVPNRLKEKVRLKELMTQSELTAKMKLPLFLGKDSSGRPLISDLAAMPHLLIAGTTGSGKSVAMNTIIMGFLYTQKPSDLKMVLVDPKMVEMSQFRDIPHLMCPVVTEMNKAAAILEWAVTKMDERYELLSEAGCRDISSYNGMTWEELKDRFQPQNEVEEAKIPRKLPYMVFIIDELADLIMTNKEVETSIVRIAQKARAVGIHLILATQRPQANVVTGLIKSNMPGRICFKVASGMDSRIVLDMKGGELLLGQGDMLMVTPKNTAGMRAQGTLVDDKEIRRVVKFVKEVSAPTFERQLMQIRSNGEVAPEDHEQRMIENAQEDPLFDRAVEILLETGRGSVSLLQRRLAIGYTRASRLIELMGLAGILGEHKGSVARDVVITLEEWQAMKAQAEADKAAMAAGEAPTPQKVKQQSLFGEEAPAKPAPKPHHESADALPVSTATLPTKEENDARAQDVRAMAKDWKIDAAEGAELKAEQDAKRRAEAAEEEQKHRAELEAKLARERAAAVAPAAPVVVEAARLEEEAEEMPPFVVPAHSPSGGGLGRGADERLSAAAAEEPSSSVETKTIAEPVAEVIDEVEEEEEETDAVTAEVEEDEEEDDEEYEYVEVDEADVGDEDGEYEYVYEEVEQEVEVDENGVEIEASADADSEEEGEEEVEEEASEPEIKTLPFKSEGQRESAA